MIQPIINALGSWIVILDNHVFVRFEVALMLWRTRYVNDNADWNAY